MPIFDVKGELPLTNKYGTRFQWVYDSDIQQCRYYCITHDVMCDPLTGKCIICGQTVSGFD